MSQTASFVEPTFKLEQFWQSLQFVMLEHCSHLSQLLQLLQNEQSMQSVQLEHWRFSKHYSGSIVNRVMWAGMNVNGVETHIMASFEVTFSITDLY